jgi:hypothetical protein
MKLTLNPHLSKTKCEGCGTQSRSGASRVGHPPAAKALGDSAGKELKVVKKRVMSAAARAKIGTATKKRWAEFRKKAKKITG